MAIKKNKEGKDLKMKKATNVSTKDADNKPVQPKTVIKEKVIEKQVIVKKKRRLSLKTIVRIIFFLVFAGTFVWLGIYLSNNVIPVVQDWLIDHNFIESNETSDSKEERSPFVFQDNSDSESKESITTIPNVVDNVSPAVVSIAVKNTTLLRRGRGVQSSTDNIGTGFIVDSSGIIVTNQHVVGLEDAEYEIVTQDNKTYTPKEIIRDAVNDIAFIIVEAKDLPIVDLGNSTEVRVGETVIAIGTPLGDYPGSVTVGVVSGLGRTVETGDGFWEVRKEYENVLQTDAAINPGNSGGPLLNLNGEVIGVNFATTGGADNISFALPVDLVKEKLAEYKEFGEIRSPYLGVAYSMISEQEALYYDVEVGALVRAVSNDSPADNANILVGDIITKVEGETVDVSLASSLGKYAVGDRVELTIFRIDDDNEENTLTISVVLSEKPEED